MRKRTLHIAVAAILFGVLVWLSVTMREEYTTTVRAPLVITDIPEGWAIRTPVPRYLTLRFRSDGWRLAALLLGPEIRLTFIYSDLNVRKHIITAGDVIDRISLRSGVELASVEPDTVIVEADRFVERTVPVSLDASFSFRDGYGQVGPARVEPESVVVRGAESVVRRLSSWPTTPTAFENLRTPLDTQVPLAPAGMYQLTFSASFVHLALNVQPFAEKTLPGLQVEVRGTPTSREVILIPPRIEAVVRGGIQQLSVLSPSDVSVIIDYATILADSTGVIEPQVTAPEGIHVVQKRPERVQYVVRKRL